MTALQLINAAQKADPDTKVVVEYTEGLYAEIDDAVLFGKKNRRLVIKSRHLEGQFGQSETEIEWLRKELKQTEKALDEIQNEKEDLELEVSDLRSKLSESESIRQDLLDDIDKFQKENEEWNRAFKGWV